VQNIRFNTSFSYFLIFLATACVDRFYYDIDKGVTKGISITGFISDQPGPYEVRVNSIFDIESLESTRTPTSVKSIELSNNVGETEVLKEVSTGIYQTSPSGMRGVMGRVYKLKIALFDGKVYESLPDTILAPGSLDSVYLKFIDRYNDLGIKEYSFDILFDASYDVKIDDQFVWKFTGTFQAETQPENYPPNKNCFYLDEIQLCNFVPPCSGLRNVGTNASPIYERRYPCTCCQCWYYLYNDNLIISDDLFTGKGVLKGIKAQNVPLNQWTLLHKIRVDMSQMSLTNNSFRFWKAIKDQKAAIGSLFQPVTGSIPSNFVQTNGSPIPIEGLFYATAISNRTQYIKQSELPPDIRYQISLEKPIFGDDCRNLFPNSTTLKPRFWMD
jgi:hypothetical protein